MNDDVMQNRPAEPTLRAYLQLLRAPNLFTAAADVVMGFLVVRAAWQPGDAGRLALLVAASVLLYAGGVVLNDVFDLPIDRRERPERPIPSGRVSPRTAGWLGWGLLLTGIAAAGLAAMRIGHAGPGVVAVLLAGCIVAYDARLKRTLLVRLPLISCPLPRVEEHDSRRVSCGTAHNGTGKYFVPVALGPAAMGTCRALNVLLGMSVAVAAWQPAHMLVAGGIGVYVAGVTWLARTEAQQSHRPHLLGAAAVMVLGIALLAMFPATVASDAASRRPAFWLPLMLLVAVPIAWQCGRALLDPSPARVQTAVKWCILWLVVLDATIAHAAAGPEWAIAIALLLVPAMALGRWIRLT